VTKRSHMGRVGCLW